MIMMYGIKNCDTCRKALKWLEAEGIAHQFHDFRVSGLKPETLSRWVGSIGWETLLNRRGTTWRKLPEGDRDGIGAAKATALMLANPTLIKRPVFDLDDTVAVGFKDAEQNLLQTHR